MLGEARAVCVLFIVLVVVSVGVVVSTEPILMVPLFAELIGVDVCRCQRHRLQRPSLPKARCVASIMVRVRVSALGLP